MAEIRVRSEIAGSIWKIEVSVGEELTVPLYVVTVDHRSPTSQMKTAGFYSKEAVLGGVWEAHLVGPFLMLALTALLTAFYMFRVVFIAFFGRAFAAGTEMQCCAV